MDRVRSRLSHGRLDIFIVGLLLSAVFIKHDKLAMNIINVKILQFVHDYGAVTAHPFYGHFGIPNEPNSAEISTELAKSYDTISVNSASELRFWGMALLIGGQCQEAAKLFEQAQMSSPSDTSLALQRAEAHACAGHEELALEIWREFGFQDYFVRAATSSGRTIAERTHYFSMAVRVKPDDPVPYREWMQTAYDQEDWVTIVNVWALAKEHDIRDNDVYFFAAHAFQKLERIDDARALLREAMTLEGVQPNTMLALVQLYWEAGEQEAGEELLAMVKDRFPDEGYPHYFHANYLLKHGRSAEALPEFNEAIARGFENALVWERIGMARYNVEAYQGAEIALQIAAEFQAKETERGNPAVQARQIQLLTYKAATLWKLGRLSEAQEDACRALRLSGFPDQMPPLPQELVGLCTPRR